VNRDSPRAKAALAALVLAPCLALGLASCAGAVGGARGSPRIAVITPTEATAPREFRGAEDYLAAGRSRTGVGEGRHLVVADRAKGGAEAALLASIAEAAADPLVKAIVVAPALTGTAEGFRLAKQARPELFCVAAGSREDELELEASADLVVDLDRLYRAYLTPWAAKKMGARAFLALYSPSEAADPAMLRERTIMSAACAELGLRYQAVVTPAGADPAGYARAMTDSWLRDLGRDTALYCSDPALVAPLIKGAVASGGLLPDAAGQATIEAYAAAIGLNLGPAKGDPRRARNLLEAAIGPLGGRRRFGLWDADYGRASVAGVALFAARAAAAAAKGAAAGTAAGTATGLKALTAALDEASADSAWLAAYDVDPETGVKSANHVLLRQDIYVLGSGYLQSALQTVPPIYLGLGQGR
jgi:hypothetical protein